MSPEREEKRIKRALRKFSMEQITDEFLASEHDGFWCMIADQLVFWHGVGLCGETTMEDPIEYAVIINFVQSRPERQFATREEADAFGRSWSPTKSQYPHSKAPDSRG